MGNKQDSITFPQEPDDPFIEPKDLKNVTHPKEGIDAYDFKKTFDYLIGSGGYSNVFKATRRYDKYLVAIKRSIQPLEYLTVDKKQGLMNEIKNMKAFPHPLIVKIIDDFLDSAGHLCLVQEFYPEGDFSNYLKERKGAPFSEPEILQFLANILLSVFHLNSRNIFHRDLKPANFLMKRWENGKNYLHLIDFGVSKNVSDNEWIQSGISNVKGTNEYLSPEIHNAKQKKPSMAKQDVWAIGVIAYELCTFHHPFEFETQQALINAIINDPHTPIESVDYSLELKNLINQMLIKDPELRPSIKELLQVEIIRKTIITFVKQFEGKVFSEVRDSLLEKDSSYKQDLLALEERVSYSLQHTEDLSPTISQVDLPESGNRLLFVYLSGGRLFTAADKTLYVFSMTDFRSPIATYPLDGVCCSGMIIHERLYLGGYEKLHIFKLTSSLTQPPLIPVPAITTKWGMNKILRAGNQLLLGQDAGWLQVFDIKTYNITSTHQFTEGGGINDIIAIDDTHYLLAGCKGLLKTTKDLLIKHYYQGKWVTSLCHITDSIYLVGFQSQYNGLIEWDQEKDVQLFKICQDGVFSIKRVITSNNYIIKTENQGVKVLTIDDLRLKQFSLKFLLEAKEDYEWNLSDSLQLQINPSNIVIATTENERVGAGNYKRSVKVMKVKVAQK